MHQRQKNDQGEAFLSDKVERMGGQGQHMGTYWKSPNCAWDGRGFLKKAEKWKLKLTNWIIVGAA